MTVLRRRWQLSGLHVLHHRITYPRHARALKQLHYQFHHLHLTPVLLHRRRPEVQEMLAKKSFSNHLLSKVHGLTKAYLVSDRRPGYRTRYGHEWDVESRAFIDASVISCRQAALFSQLPAMSALLWPLSTHTALWRKGQGYQSQHP